MADENPEVEGNEETDAPAAPDVPAVEEPSPPSSPWAADLEKHFDDPALRGQVDGFLRENVQPYVTKLEQESQPSRDAERLWNDFSRDPNNTFRAVAVELYGDETADRLINAITDDGDTTVTDNPDNATDDLDFKIDDDELPESVREAVDFVQAERQQREWDEAFKQVAFDDEGKQIIDEELFYPFVTAADGDIDAAKDAYLAWEEKSRERFGVNVPSPEDVEVPPKTIDPNGGGATTTPPQQEKYETIDDAMDAFFAEQNAPPTV